MTEFRLIVDNQFARQLLNPHSAFNVCLLLFCSALLSCSKGTADARPAARNEPGSVLQVRLHLYEVVDQFLA